MRLVLNFHGIGRPPHWVGAEELPYWCPEADFESILDEIPRVSESSGTPVEITFDDGNVSDVTIAAPALRARGLTASFFVCAGRIGTPGYLDAAHLRELAGLNMTVGSHGWAHVDWRRLDHGAALDREILAARGVIAAAVSAPVHSVAIPFGSYNRRIWTAVTRAFATVYTSDTGLAPDADRVIPRETYTTRWDADTLAAMASRRSPYARVRRSLSVAYKRYR